MKFLQTCVFQLRSVYLKDTFVHTVQLVGKVGETFRRQLKLPTQFRDNPYKCKSLLPHPHPYPYLNHASHCACVSVCWCVLVWVCYCDSNMLNGVALHDMQLKLENAAKTRSSSNFYAYNAQQVCIFNSAAATTTIATTTNYNNS